MTSLLFEEEIRKWDFELKGKKILLLVDNCPAHPAIADLQNIELHFLPANTTIVLQPMDQSVIKSLKSHYRRRLLMELVETDGNFKATILDAVQMISRAWKDMTEKTIRHSFKHAGWLEDQAAREDDDDDLPLAVWARQIELPTVYEPEELQNYETVDEAVATTAGVSDDDILNAVRVNDEDEDSDQEEFDPEPEPVPTSQQALEAAKILHKFFTYHDDDPVATENVSRLQDKVRSLLWKTKKRQTTLKDFFK